MAIFWRLILAHFIADFTLQCNDIARGKRATVWEMLVHCLIHPAVSAVLVWPFLKTIWIQMPGINLPGWVCILLIGFFHWVTDLWRAWSIKNAGTPDNTKVFLLDQLVHICIIMVFAPFIPGMKAQIWVFIALFVVLLTHFTSVFIFFLENDLGGPSQVLGEKKYKFMAERLSAVVLFLLPGYGFLLAFAWIAWVLFVYYRRVGDRSWVHLSVSSVAVVLFGLAMRGLLYQ
jgi:hypothetical protein